MQKKIKYQHNMSENNNERKSGLDKRIVLFFVFAVLCVAAFLIVILVKSCDADHEEKEYEEIQQEEVVMVPQTHHLQLFS